MKKALLIFLMVLVCFPAMAFITFEADDGREVPVSNAYPMPVAATFTLNVGTLTLSLAASPVYANASGTAAASSPLDVALRVQVNIGSETINLISNIQALQNKLATDTWGLKVSITSFTTQLPAGTNAIGFAGSNCISSFSTSFTLAVGTATAVIVPALGGTARVLHIITDQDLNFGGTDTPTGTKSPYIPGGCPDFTFNISTGTTGIYVRGRTASCSVLGFVGAQ
jgi:hypothetical protein